MSAVQLRAEFLGVEGKRIFFLLYSPAGECARCVLIVPPFAEEMNKSRRMMTLVAEALVERNVAVAIPDLYGTGDSEGEFEQASWEEWVANIKEIRRWCEKAGFTTDGVIGIRLGCALGVEALCCDSTSMKSTVFWQPVVDGSRALDQFLRLRVAAAAMNDDMRETVKVLRHRLLDGEAIEVAGYRLSPTMAEQLDRVKLSGSYLTSDRTHWMEIVSSIDSPMPAASARVIEGFRSRGCEVDYRQLVGEPFWSTSEIATVPVLIDRTIDALCGSS